MFHVSTIQDNVRLQARNSSRAMWACDAQDFSSSKSMKGPKYELR